jgi:hypothetical protein
MTEDEWLREKNDRLRGKIDESLNDDPELRDPWNDYDVGDTNDTPFGGGTSDIIIASVLRDYKLGLEARTWTASFLSRSTRCPSHA